MDEINRKRLEWVASAKPGAMDWGGDLFVTNGNRAAGWGEAMSEMAATALSEIVGYEHSFDLSWDADMRAIKRWQAAAPPGEDRSLTWPDHADLVVWLLEQRAAGDWRPIAEAPIQPASQVTPYWTFPCLLQTERGIVTEGFARWVEDGRMKGARETCTLRWYLGSADRGRDTRVCHDPKYFMPLPAKRED